MQYPEIIMRSLGAPAPTSQARREALSWLASQLRWERTLERLRWKDTVAGHKAA